MASSQILSSSPSREEEKCGGSRHSARAGLLHLGPDDQPHRAEGCVTSSKGAEDESKEGLAQTTGSAAQRGEAGRIG